MELTLTIGDVARQAGLATSAIRYYETIGVLPAPARVGGNRRYGREVLRQLRLIAAAKRAGFSLVEIGELLHGPPPTSPLSARWRRLAEARLAALDRQLAQIEVARRVLLEGMRCECFTAEDCRACSGAPDLPGERVATG